METDTDDITVPAIHITESDNITTVLQDSIKFPAQKLQSQYTTLAQRRGSFERMSQSKSVELPRCHPDPPIISQSSSVDIPQSLLQQEYAADIPDSILQKDTDFKLGGKQVGIRGSRPGYIRSMTLPTNIQPSEQVLSRGVDTVINRIAAQNSTETAQSGK